MKGYFGFCNVNVRISFVDCLTIDFVVLCEAHRTGNVQQVYL